MFVENSTLINKNMFQAMLHTTKPPSKFQIRGFILLKEHSTVIMIHTWIEGSVCGRMTVRTLKLRGGRWILETAMWSWVSTSQIEIQTSVSCTSHYNDVIMGATASEITSLTIVWSKKTSILRATGLCEGNSPVTGEFPTQRASNAENISIWWRHHEMPMDDIWQRRGSTVCW